MENLFLLMKTFLAALSLLLCNPKTGGGSHLQPAEASEILTLVYSALERKDEEGFLNCMGILDTAATASRAPTPDEWVVLRSRDNHEQAVASEEILETPDSDESEEEEEDDDGDNGPTAYVDSNEAQAIDELDQIAEIDTRYNDARIESPPPMLQDHPDISEPTGD